ncbi:MAG: DNA-binding protein YbiB [Betaproteobacteria bacterium]|nr:DNA-binding protein YbiB [Betaproteobacteria bacterium]
MSPAHILRRLARAADEPPDLSADEAQALFAAMLDDAIPDLELGALLYALRLKGTTTEELAGFVQALESRTTALAAPDHNALPVVIPSYHGARSQPNLMPLLAMMLARLDVPVLVHATLEPYGGVSSAAVFRQLGVLPSATPGQANEALARDRLALVPTTLLAPGLARLLRLRAQLGMRTCAHAMAKVLDPFRGGSLRLVPASRPRDADALRELLIGTDARALLFLSGDGEAHADPHRRPRIELLRDARAEVLYEAEHAPLDSLPGLPPGAEPKAVAAWTRRVLAGQAPLPLPLANQLACCLYGSGRVASLARAKAVAAVHTVGVMAA